MTQPNSDEPKSDDRSTPSTESEYDYEKDLDETLARLSNVDRPLYAKDARNIFFHRKHWTWTGLLVLVQVPTFPTVLIGTRLLIEAHISKLPPESLPQSFWLRFLLMLGIPIFTTLVSMYCIMAIFTYSSYRMGIVTRDEMFEYLFKLRPPKTWYTTDYRQVDLSANNNESSKHLND